MSEVLTELVGLVGQVTDQPVEEIVPETRFDAMAEWGSFSALRLLTGIEQRFGVRLNLEEYFAIKDVGGLAKALSEALVVRS